MTERKEELVDLKRIATEIEFRELNNLDTSKQEKKLLEGIIHNMSVTGPPPETGQDKLYYELFDEMNRDLTPLDGYREQIEYAGLIMEMARKMYQTRGDTALFRWRFEFFVIVVSRAGGHARINELPFTKMPGKEEKAFQVSKYPYCSEEYRLEWMDRCELNVQNMLKAIDLHDDEDMATYLQNFIGLALASAFLFPQEEREGDKKL